MDWIYISPHLDDVALSCGGRIWEQRQAGERVEIWTIFAGDAPEGTLSPFADVLHARWQTGREAMANRRLEDALSCARIHASYRHFPYPDCIYRRVQRTVEEREEKEEIDHTGEGEFLYTSHQSLFGPIHPVEDSFMERLSLELAQKLPQGAELACPLTMGRHVDHRLTRAAMEKLGRPLWYYADFPYVLDCQEEIEALERAGWKSNLVPVSQAGFEAWEEAVASHQSQISSFWSDLEAMRTAIRSYMEYFDGAILWQPLG